MNFTIVFGTRPQIIKCVPVIRQCVKKKIGVTIINTGQHYDFELNKIFLREFNLPKPRYNLGVGSGLHGWQTGNIMIQVEKVLKEFQPSVCMVPGDTNSAIAGALAAVKLKIHVAHLEAGLRNFNEFMPEEINRRSIDHICQLLFAPTRTAKQNLLTEGISPKKIILSGDTMYDLFLQEKEKIGHAQLPKGLNDLQDYLIVTTHREENTKDPKVLTEVLSAIKQFNIPTVFPIHPRTKKRLRDFGLFDAVKKIKNLILIDPLGYHSMIRLMQRSMFILTDSGGIQKEAYMTNVPCITLRKDTEWTETVKIGANTLICRLEREQILTAMRHVIKNRELIVRRTKKSKKLYGDGKASNIVIKAMLDRLSI